MHNLNTSRMAPSVVALLYSRGTELPPLRWPAQPNRAAKKTIESTDDVALFGKAPATESAAAAVRSLLYLWNGWAGECAMHAELAAAPDRFYLLGLAERHQGHPDAAKKFLQQVFGHPVYANLTRITIESKPADARVKRFADVLQMNGTWDPFAFIDLCEVAAAGKVGPEGDDLIRSLQCHEFGLLMAHCYELATGEAVLNLKNTTTVEERPRPNRTVTRKSPPRPSTSRPSAEEGTARTSSLLVTGPRVLTAAASGPPIRVLCPKCNKVGHFPAFERGRAVRCKGCGAAMMIPATD